MGGVIGGGRRYTEGRYWGAGETTVFIKYRSRQCDNVIHVIQVIIC